MCKQNYNWTLFSKYETYTISEIAERLGFSKRTISENWRKEGLIIMKSKIKGSNLIIFLKWKKEQRKKTPEKSTNGESFYCMSAKRNVIYPSFNLFEIHIDKNNNLKLSVNCNNNSCSNRNCQKTVKNLSKFISLSKAKDLKRKTESERTLLTPRISITKDAKNYIISQG